ncbi:MAG: RNA methyltransferase [Clostridia bacterium]|nr:RNA methyltransferase [Clostridia bacterium]MBR3271992.1 RNA methyltransferase [Clostridia bacterium]
MIITSRTNDRVKAVRALQQSKSREATGLHLIEGDKLVRDAVQSGARIETVYAVEGVPVPEGVPTVTVTESVMEAMSTQKTPQSLCAVVHTPSAVPPESYPKGLIVALDRLQDPGNLGTILRTADALGAAGLLLSSDSVDPFSPKALRAAMGSTYHLPVWIGNLAEELPRLIEQGYTCICGHLGGDPVLPPLSEKTVLVVGNEGQGVSDEVASLCVRYRMPMKGRAESLNAAIFAALMMQRILQS